MSKTVFRPAPPLNIESKNAKWDEVLIDENPDSAYDTFF